MKTLVPIKKIKKDFEKFHKFNFDDSFDFYILDSEESNNINDFINESVKSFTREMYVKQNEDHIDNLYSRGGFAIGAFKSDCLCALISMDFSLFDSKFKKMNSRSVSMSKKPVVFDTIVVNEDCRKYNLGQKLMVIGEYLSLEKGYENAFCTLSPYNYYSVTNALKSDFYIYSIEDMYGDKEPSENSVKRYLAHLPLGKKRIDVLEQYSVKSLDFKAQKDVLELGFCGFKTINFKSIDNFYLSYSMMYYE